MLTGPLRDIETALLATGAGGAGCVVVDGPAGAGKSRTLAASAKRARALDLAVAGGRATELDRAAPLTSMLVALRAGRPPVIDDAGLADLADLHGNRFWLIDRLGGLIERSARCQPLLIALDDVQAADELSALAVRILVPALRECPVLWLLAHRRTPRHSPIRTMLDGLVQDGATRIALGRQSAEVSRGAIRLLAAPASGWDSLTHSERRVARLVAQGLTNRAVARQLLVSPHTVDTHLRRTFVKLGVSCRVDLTRLILAHENPPSVAA